MIRYLVKNNFKLMMRSATNILLYIVTPIILVAMLSSAFGDMMEKYESGDSVKAGYRLEAAAGSEIIDYIKPVAEEENINLYEYSDGDIEKLIREEELAGFVVFEEDGGYTIYENDAEKYGAKALEYMITTFLTRSAAEIMTAAGGVGESGEVELVLEKASFMEPIDAVDYYGIIEVVYFGWCAIVCGAGIFTAEKKYHIGKKLEVSGLSGVKLYLAKFIPMVLVVSVSSIISALITILVFGVHWGAPLLSFLIVVLSAAASTAFGLMVYSITQNTVVTIIGVFAVVWFMGFWGGSFETYMFSSHPQILKDISPIYHVNRALVELSCMGHSDYVVSSIVFTLGIMVICSLVAVLTGTIRRGKGEC